MIGTLVVVVVILAPIVAVLGIFLGRLRGTVTLARVREPTRPVRLDVWPWMFRPTDDLIGVIGRILIVGIPFTRQIHVWIRCPGRPDGDGRLRPGGRRYVSGVWITYDASDRREEVPSSPDSQSPES